MRSRFLVLHAPIFDLLSGLVSSRFTRSTRRRRGALCQRAEETLPCGAATRKALQALVAGGPLWCVQVVHNRRGSVSICRRDGADVNEAMVAAGMARADRLYSSRYVPA